MPDVEYTLISKHSVLSECPKDKPQVIQTGKGQRMGKGLWTAKGLSVRRKGKGEVKRDIPAYKEIQRKVKFSQKVLACVLQSE